MDDISTNSSNNLSEQIDNARFREYKLISLDGPHTRFFILSVVLYTICDIQFDIQLIVETYIHAIQSQIDPQCDNIFVSFKTIIEPKETLYTKIMSLVSHVKQNKTTYIKNIIIALVIANCIYERNQNS